MKNLLGEVAILAALTSTSIGVNLHHVMTCTSDPECKHGYYCVVRTGYCQECIECSKYNRLPSPKRSTMSSSVCGDCLPGYSLPPHSPHSGSSNYYCIRINTPQSANDNAATNSHAIGDAYIFIGFVGFIICLIYGKIYIDRRSEHTERITAVNVEQNLCQPLQFHRRSEHIERIAAVNVEENLCQPLQDESTVGLVDCRKESENNQAANCYIIPRDQRRPKDALNEALTDADEARLIIQHGESDDVEEEMTEPPIERDPISEKVSLVVVDSRNMSTMPACSSANNGTFSVDLNENILNQSSTARSNKYHQADNTPSSDEDEATNLTNQWNGNVVVLIQQNMKVKK